MNSAGQTKLQLRLESSEPKCGNCRVWSRQMESVGTCGLLGNSLEAGGNIRNYPAITTDLSVCSKWEPKE